MDILSEMLTVVDGITAKGIAIWFVGSAIVITLILRIVVGNRVVKSDSRKALLKRLKKLDEETK